jgi:hypothetical protein
MSKDDCQTERINMSETEKATAEVRALEAIAAKLEQRAATLEAQIKTVADDCREQQQMSGLAGIEAARNAAYEKSKALAAKERALREEDGQAA